VADAISEEEKRKQRDTQFTKDLRAAFNEGQKAANDVLSGAGANIAIDHLI